MLDSRFLISLLAVSRKQVFRLFVLIELSQHNDLMISLRELPATKDQQMGADGSGCVSVSLCRRITDVLAILPAHFFRAPDLEIFALFLLEDVFISVA